MSTRFLLFGGTGFLGAALAEALVSRHADVVTISRRQAAGRPMIRHVRADITRPRSLERIIGSGDVVINLVGLSPVQRPVRGRAAYRDVHVRGTANLLEAAISAGARGFVYLSALGVRTHAGAAYAETKARAEAIVRARCSKAGIPYTIVAPSVLFGGGSEITGFLQQVGRLWPDPLPVPLPQHPGRFRPVHVDDAAAHIADALMAGDGQGADRQRSDAASPGKPPGGQPGVLPDYLPVTGPEALSFDELAAVMLRAVGLRTTPLPRMVSAALIAVISMLKLPGVPSELNAMLAIDNEGPAPGEAEGMQRFTEWVQGR